MAEKKQYRFGTKTKRGIPRDVIDGGCDKRVADYLIGRRKGTRAGILQQYARRYGEQVQ